MPLNMPEKALITVQRRELNADYSMPQMEMADSHYSLGYIISGDRRVITPFQQFDVHAGNVTVMPPQLYHRTFSMSERPYISYLVKISEELAEEFCREVDRDIWNDVFEGRYYTFNEDDIRLIEQMLEDMLYVYGRRAGYSDIILKGQLYRLVIMIWEKNTGNEAEYFKSRLSADIMEAMYYIERHYAEDIRLCDAAENAGFSEGHFSRLFKAGIGQPFSVYLKNVRLRHAKELLINTDMSISEIAMETGFSTGDYLSACFSSDVGITPTKFRRMMQQK